MDVYDLGPNDGVGVQSYHVVREMARRGHEVDVVYLNDGPWAAEYGTLCRSLRKVPSLEFSPKHLSRDPDGNPVWPAIIAGVRSRPQVIYHNGFHAPWWPVVIGGVLRVPVVSHFHGFVPFEMSRARKLATRRVDRYITVSEAMRTDLVARGVTATPIHVVYNGVDPSQYPWGGRPERDAARGRLGLPVDGPVVLYMGGINPNKGVDLLITAAQALARTRDGFRLLIAGTGDDPVFVDALRHASSGFAVTWLGRLTDVTDALHASDVLAVPSRWDEPFARVVIEAMVSGRPVVAARSGGLPEILTGEFTQGLFARNDAEDLRAKLDDMLDWREHDPDLGRRCRDHVVEHFSFTKMVDAIEDHLSRAIFERRGRVEAGGSAEGWQRTVSGDG